MQPNMREIERIIDTAMAEDLGQGDITSTLTIPANATTHFRIRAREPLVTCGLPVAERVFAKMTGEIKTAAKIQEGDMVNANTLLMEGSGNARAILAAERVALNLLRQMCGVATITHQFVEKTKGTKAKILDTRKTIPGLREIQKYAVRTGGGFNHRFRLDDGVLIKDNHIAIAGNITKAMAKARKETPALTRIEVECETLDQIQEALAAGADILLLDNMDTATLKKAVKLVDGRAPLEASGGITLKNVAEVAHTGVDFISVGMLTNSPPSVDIALDID